MGGKFSKLGSVWVFRENTGRGRAVIVFKRPAVFSALNRGGRVELTKLKTPFVVSKNNYLHLQSTYKKYTVFTPTCFGGQTPFSRTDTKNMFDLKRNEAILKLHTPCAIFKHILSEF